MAGENIVEVRFGSDVSGLRAGAREATAHIESLRGTMLDMKAEATQTGRAARFFANDIASLVPVSIEAKGAVMGLFEVMLAGGAIGAAVGSVKLIIEAFKLLTEEETKSKDSFKKFIDEQTDSVDKLKTSVEKMILTMQGATRAQLLEFEQTHDLQTQKRDLNQRLEQSERKLAETKAYAATVDAEDVATMVAAIAVGEHQVAGLKEQIKTVDELISKKKAAIVPLAGADATEAAKQIALAESIEEAKRAAAQATVDAEVNLQRIKTEQEKGIEREKATFDEALAREIADAKRRADQATEESAINLGRIETEQRRLTKDQLKDLKLQIHEMGAVAKEVGLVVGEAFAGMASGSMDAGKAIIEILKAIVKALIEAAIKMVIAHAAAAAAGAAESQASIPLAGPFLAIAAMAAVEGAVLALLSIIPSAAGGFDIPHGVNPITQLHGGEMVLPAELADKVRNGSASDGSGGDLHLHFHGTLIDGPGVEKVFRSPHVIRTISMMRRLGEWPG